MVLPIHRLHPIAAKLSRTIVKRNVRSTLQPITCVCFEPNLSIFGAKRSFSSDPITLTHTEEWADAPLASALEAAERVDFLSVTDVSFGPSGIALRTLELIHSATGLPWWLTIIASTIAIRAAFFPLTILATRNSARMRVADPELKAIQEEMQQSNFTRAQQLDIRNRYMAIMKKHNIKMSHGFFPMTQVPVFFGFFWGLGMAPDYFPGYSNGGVSWFTDLSATDPTLALPIISSLCMLASVQITKEDFPIKYKSQMIFGMRVLSLAMIPFVMDFSAGLHVYWVTSNMFTVLQSAALRNTSLRKSLGIPALPVQKIDQQMIALDVAGTDKTTPFQAAVARAKEGAAIPTHYHPPKKGKQN